MYFIFIGYLKIGRHGVEPTLDTPLITQKSESAFSYFHCGPEVLIASHTEVQNINLILEIKYLYMYTLENIRQTGRI